MKRIERIRNPYQDRINALNFKDIEEEIRLNAFLKKSRDPIPDDINNTRFPMTDILVPNVLKPEELSMKDLLDQIQIQTILNNNIAPYVKKEIKSEVTQEMIKEFQNESAKPVEINGVFYKFRPPNVTISLKDVPSSLPSEEDYKRAIETMYNSELKTRAEIERRRVIVTTALNRTRDLYNDSRMTREEYFKAMGNYDDILAQLEEADDANQLTLASLRKDYDRYEEIKLAHDTQVDLITKENQKSLASYEDELKSRNTGLEVGQQEGESDADYAQRLLDTAQTSVDPAQVEAQAKLFLYNTMKDRMNELGLPAYKSEAVLNTIVQAGGHEKLQVIKDSWPSVKKLLVDTFGDIKRVENTDNIAQLMYNYSMKPFVRPAGPAPFPVPPPARSTPTTIPTAPSTVLSYTPTTAPKLEIYKAKYKPAPAPYVSEYTSFKSPTKSGYTSFADLPLPLDFTPTSRPRAPTPSQKSKLPQVPADVGFSSIPRRAPIPSQLPTRPKIPAEVGLYPTEKEKAAYEAELKALYSLQPDPLSQRSKSVEQQFQEAGGKKGRPLSQMANQELKNILERNGLPVDTSSRARQRNYDAVATAGLLPPRVKLISLEDFKALGQSRMAQYLEDNQMTGPSGGVPVNSNGQPKSEEILLQYFNRYSSTGSGFKSEHVRNVKDEFAIIDGEIQAGNNNPQLMRDARKMLKEMVQKKMVTLYEAQKHMLHLRKIIKI